MITEDKTVQFQVNTLSLDKVLEVKKSFSWYSIGSSKTKVRLEDGPKVIAFFDTSAKINVMTKEVMENAGLAMRPEPKLELVSYIDYS